MKKPWGRAMVLAGMCALFAGGAAAADGPPVVPADASRCTDAWGDDLCSPADRGRKLAMYDLERAEDLASAGTSGLRVFFVDGYGRDMPVVEFRRTPRGATAKWTAAFYSEAPARTTRSRVLDVASWDEVGKLARVALEAPRNPVPSLDSWEGEEEVRVCGHGWMATVEVWGPVGVSRRVVNACDDDDAFDAAFAIGLAVYREFPECVALDADQYQNEIAKLQACGRLSGDRRAAAAVMNRFNSQPYDEADVADPQQVADLFTVDTDLRWPDRPPALGREQASTFWSDLTRGQEAEAYYGRVDGVAAGEVVIVGEIYVDRPKGDDPKDSDEFSADYTQVWIRDVDGAWRIRRWTVQPFRIVH